MRLSKLIGKIRKLQGKVDIERTGEFITDEDGNKWEKCIFTVELTNFSKRAPDEVVPPEIKGKKGEAYPLLLLRLALRDRS